MLRKSSTSKITGGLRRSEKSNNLAALANDQAADLIQVQPAGGLTRSKKSCNLAQIANDESAHDAEAETLTDQIFNDEASDEAIEYVSDEDVTIRFAKRVAIEEKDDSLDEDMETGSQLTDAMAKKLSITRSKPIAIPIQTGSSRNESLKDGHGFTRSAAATHQLIPRRFHK